MRSMAHMRGISSKPTFPYEMLSWENRFRTQILMHNRETAYLDDIESHEAKADRKWLEAEGQMSLDFAPEMR